MNENVALIEALDKNNKDLADSRATNNILHVKLEEAENRIIEIRYEKNSLESNLKNIKKGHQQEINHANDVIKTLEKGSKGLKKEIHNLNRNLENTRDTLKNLKSEHSSLKINKTKLDAEMMKLKKVISRKDFNITHLSKKDVNQNDVKLTESSHTLSLCSSSSKSLSSILTASSRPPFNSMISNWNPLPVTPPLMLTSITTMVTHCIRLPPPSCSLMSAQEFQEMMEKFLERAFANLQWNSLVAKIDL